MSERLSIHPTQEAWEKFYLYVRLAKGEVGGLGSVQQRGASLLMTDCFLIDQRATDVDCELDPEATSTFLIDFVERGGDPGVLGLWWHSHAKEACFWSDDDERTIDNFGGETLISIVGNHAGKFLARLDRYEPRRETIGWVDFVPPGPPPSESGPAAERARAELAQRVRLLSRRTNKLWTDGDLPGEHGHG